MALVKGLFVLTDDLFITTLSCYLQLRLFHTVFSHQIYLPSCGVGILSDVSLYLYCKRQMRRKLPVKIAYALQTEGITPT